MMCGFLIILNWRENMSKYIPSEEVIISGMLGKAVGDALGVPVEFEERSKRDQAPVENMRSGGYHGKAEGTWSDDTSMAIAAMASIVDEKDVNFDKIMDYFILWFDKAFFTADGERFDKGTTVEAALDKYKQDRDINSCGPTDDGKSGNGSLMRIFPFAIYYADGLINGDIASIINIATASAITHASLLCKEICIVYSTAIAYFAKYIDEGNVTLQDKNLLLQNGLNLGFENVKKYCDSIGIAQIDNRILFAQNVDALHTINRDSIEELPSGGFVLDSFRAALWCFTESSSYSECVLKAVNLGKDTDTTAAIVGALAGVYYSEKNIPEEWKKVTLRVNDIITTCEEFHYLLLNEESYLGKAMVDLWNPHINANIKNKAGLFGKLFGSLK